jgi:LuxR family maltose regulon positive regulatory protein
MDPSGLPKNILERVGSPSGIRLTLLVAPDSSEKTRLLGRWAAMLETDQNKVAWLRLQVTDNDPERFWADLLKALNSAYALDLPARCADLESAMTELINRLACNPASLVLILDDYHVINNETVHQAVGLLLDYPPPGVTLVIATRSEPPLQIPRLRARRQLDEIRLDIEAK